MHYFPMFCLLRDKPCLIVGAGEVAERKAHLLLDAGARLTVVAPQFSETFQAWAADGRLQLVTARFTAALLDGHWLVIAATNDSAVNAEVHAAANHRQIFSNVVDDPAHSSFIMPSIIDRSPVIVAVSTGGSSPVLARLLREKLEALLPMHLGQLAELAGQLRQRVRQRFSQLLERRRFWERLLRHAELESALTTANQPRVAAIVEQLLEQPEQAVGEVILVGAGPGDPGLLTLKALQHLQEADVVVYDRLVSAEVMNLIRRDARKIFVGKEAGAHSVPQPEINQLLVDLARNGHRVVRLKGGDPFIFGRGGEELEVVKQAGIPFQVVPGITAANGCAAYAGIPLTHRDYAQSVRFITASGKPGAEEPDWAPLAREAQTLVFYMGVQQAARIHHGLIQHGRAPNTPVAIVEHGTTARQRVRYCTLQTLPETSQGVESPSLIIVGEVVALADRLAWFTPPPETPAKP